MKILAIKMVNTAVNAKFQVFALAKDRQENCPTLEFLDELQKTRRADFDRLKRQVETTSQNGPPHNIQKFRCLGDKLFEFKTRGGARLLCFFDADRLILCSNGFLKQRDKTPPEEIERAKQWRNDYALAKAGRTLEFID